MKALVLEPLTARGTRPWILLVRSRLGEPRRFRLVKRPTSNGAYVVGVVSLGTAPLRGIVVDYEIRDGASGQASTSPLLVTPIRVGEETDRGPVTG